MKETVVYTLNCPVHGDFTSYNRNIGCIFCGLKPKVRGFAIVQQEEASSNC